MLKEIGIDVYVWVPRRSGHLKPWRKHSKMHSSAKKAKRWRASHRSRRR